MTIYLHAHPHVWYGILAAAVVAIAILAWMCRHVPARLAAWLRGVRYARDAGHRAAVRAADPVWGNLAEHDEAFAGAVAESCADPDCMTMVHTGQMPRYVSERPRTEAFRLPEWEPTPLTVTVNLPPWPDGPITPDVLRDRYAAFAALNLPAVATPSPAAQPEQACGPRDGGEPFTGWMQDGPGTFHAHRDPCPVCIADEEPDVIEGAVVDTAVLAIYAHLADWDRKERKALAAWAEAVENPRAIEAAKATAACAALVDA